ncbi:hypothetical protein MJO28_011034 [Puccinia striiformis f. sp. tritici]|uniref:Uncharacterized protein n=2 Tax=Puccinia striiformis f. sp. tritici TaxID=168172 RepID=A0A0L0VKD9_9BASI|nr:hypothetical protein Pst134EA_020749 [Puccinia striiformis f. sp. tritici]KAH9456837.1 hypothetical protein Pst134EA_020749 [Puccinia striiformis f. sp. tritici]KAI7943506.1 hypothetical protein MJO28_011034 [Puccinia striiformis f. sp. tritici]KNE99738.1 hypothetical protein PSTG_07026 [Puccinia striiformis f. sp. tritici PST-78]
MNTPQSMALGWGLLLVAGGGGLYLAKKDINERRRDLARRGVRATDTRECHERGADDQTPNHQDVDTRTAPAVKKTSPATNLSSTAGHGLSSTFSTLDRPSHRTPGSRSDPSQTRESRAKDEP